MRATPKKSVLVADDDADVRATLREFLVNEGFTVLEARNGLEVLLQIKHKRPDAILLDLFMPRLGGLGALKHIRDFDPNIAVIVVTGTNDPQLLEEATTLGAVAALHKPVALNALLRALGQQDVALAAEAMREPDAIPDSTPSISSGVSAPPRGRILVADDDPEVCQVIEDLLVDEGYSVRAVATAGAAFWAVAEEVPDVVLLDIAMPGLTGVEAIPAIRFISHSVKIIMVSGVTDVALAKRALAYGAFDYVTKPIDTAYLLQTIDTALALT
jgi:CheY-like chemotaxis protein